MATEPEANPTRVNGRGLASQNTALPPTSIELGARPSQRQEPSTRFPPLDPADLDLPLPASMNPQDLTLDPLLTTLTKAPMGKHTIPFISGIPLLSRIGRGGMGAVYYGMHLRLGIEVAVKILPFHLAELNPDSVKRFAQEAKLSARIQSDHLVRVLDVNEENGLYFLVMEFVYGETAGSYLKKIRDQGAKGMPERDAIEVMRAVGEGLNAAHRAGIVHRDIKPDNILIPWRNDGTPEFSRSKLADLGLSRVESEDKGITVTQMAMGTPGFMAPEQADDAKRAGRSADVYSMAASLYNLIAGHPPFHGKPMIQIVLDTQQKPHESLRKLVPETSLALSSTLDCCLAKNPLERLPDGEKWNDALSQCMERPFEPPKVVAQYKAASSGHLDETFKPDSKMLNALQSPPKPEGSAPAAANATAASTAPTPVFPQAAPAKVPVSKSKADIEIVRDTVVGYALEKPPDVAPPPKKREEPEPKAIGYWFMSLVLFAAMCAIGVKFFWPKAKPVTLPSGFESPVRTTDTPDTTPPVLPGPDGVKSGGNNGYDQEIRDAEAALQSGKFKEAVDAYVRAIQINADSSVARKGINIARSGLKVQEGQALLKSKEWSKAEQAFNAALALYADNEAAKAGLEKAKSKQD